MKTVGRPPVDYRLRKSEILSVRVTPSVYRTVEMLAKRERTSVTKIIERAILFHLGYSQENVRIAEAEDRYLSRPEGTLDITEIIDGLE